jgi:hypothetical protein
VGELQRPGSRDVCQRQQERGVKLMATVQTKPTIIVLNVDTFEAA